MDYCGIHLVRIFQAATLLELLRTLARGISIAARLVAANLNALHGDWPETGMWEVFVKLPITRRIIKGRPFEVGFECQAKLYGKEHPYGP